VLSQCSEVGIVAQHGHADRADLLGEDLGERHVVPAEVGRQTYEPVVAADDAGHAEPHADQGGVGLDVTDDETHQVDHGRRDRVGVVVRRDRPGGPGTNDPAQADTGDRQAVDPQVDRQDVRARAGLDVDRRAPGADPGP
jgi:hypothetical protein